jgi:predicted MFS family arabinose efflux permease
MGPRSAWQLVADRQFGTIFWGKLVSVFAVWAYTISAAIVGYEATRSALFVGLIGAAQYLPQLVFGPLSGKASDKYGAIPQIVAGRVACALAAAALGYYLSAAGDDSDIRGPLLCASLMTGIGFVIGSPAMQAIVPKLVTRQELPVAVGLNTLPMVVGRALGPAAGAFMLVHLGPGWTFVVVASCHAIFACAVLITTWPARDSSESDTRVRAALSFVWRDRTALVLLVGVAAVAFGSEPSTSLSPVIARDLGGGPSWAGLIASTFGVGAMVGFVLQVLFRGKAPPSRQASLGLTAMATGLVVACVGYVPVAIVTGMAITGMGMAWGLSGLSTLLQWRTPDALMGRVMALWLVAFGGMRPVASFAAGGIADVFSARVALSLTALSMVAMAVAARPNRLRDRASDVRGVAG